MKSSLEKVSGLGFPDPGEGRALQVVQGFLVSILLFPKIGGHQE